MECVLAIEYDVVVLEVLTCGVITVATDGVADTGATEYISMELKSARICCGGGSWNV